MKTIKLFGVIALIFGMTLSSCTKEQSELKLSDLTGSATISGQVKYNQGIKTINGVIYENYLEPIANQEVYIDLDLSNYKSNADGVERYTTTTDEDGFYSITIPAGQNTVSDEIQVTPFTGEYAEVANGVTYSYDNAIYQESEGVSFSVNSGDSKVYNITLSSRPIMSEETLDRYVTTYGSMQIATESVSYSSSNQVIIGSSYEDLTDDEYVNIKVTHSSDSRTILYPVEVYRGEFDMKIYFYDSWDFEDVTLTLTRSKITITEDDSSSKKFTHYYVFSSSLYSFETQLLTGYYASFEDVLTLKNSSIELEYEFPSRIIYFTPDDTNSINGIQYYSSVYEYNNPFNW